MSIMNPKIINNPPSANRNAKKAILVAKKKTNTPTTRKTNPITIQGNPEFAAKYFLNNSAL